MLSGIVADIAQHRQPRRPGRPKKGQEDPIWQGTVRELRELLGLPTDERHFDASIDETGRVHTKMANELRVFKSPAQVHSAPLSVLHEIDSRARGPSERMTINDPWSQEDLDTYIAFHRLWREPYQKMVSDRHLERYRTDEEYRERYKAKSRARWHEYVRRLKEGAEADHRSKRERQRVWRRYKEWSRMHMGEHMNPVGRRLEHERFMSGTTPLDGGESGDGPSEDG